MLLITVLSSILLFSFVSMSYVYLYRGHARFANVTEYLRKGWPIFTPLNCLLYIFTKKKARQAIIDPAKFEELKVIADNWEVIRDEVMALHKKDLLKNTTNPESSSYYDVGFRTFYKYGWSKFYLKWYGHTHNSAKEHCPKTVEILSKASTVNGAMFSILPPGSKLTRHLDPVACSLRYHLGLRTPNSDDCFISVDENVYSWRDGEPFIFDETYLHFAKNNSNEDRLILMCDIDRPMNIFGKIINFIYKLMMRFTVVPNLPGDKRGLVNSIFSSVSPLLKKSKNLKATNKNAYLTLKYTVNTILILLVLAIVLGTVKLVSLAF